MWVRRITTYGRLIKFSHTIFALPFALAAVLLAHSRHPLTLSTLVWIILAMAGARSAAMGFNRYADCGFDSRNSSKLRHCERREGPGQECLFPVGSRCSLHVRQINEPTVSAL